MQTKLSASSHGVVLDLLGDWPIEGGNLSMVNKFNLNDALTMHGHVDIPYDRVGQASAFVPPIMSEGISRASMESLFLDSPVVARDVDGNNSLVNGGVNGTWYFFSFVLQIVKRLRRLPRNVG